MANTKTPAEIHQQYFPGEPMLVLQGRIVPRELYRPVQLLIAEIERLRAEVTRWPQCKGTAT